MASQQKMQTLLSQAGIPAKEIKVFGSQIIITCWSRDAAEKFAGLLTKFAKVRGIVESRDNNLVNTNTVLRPTSHKVWRVGAYV